MKNRKISENYLEYIPCHNPEIKWEMDKEGNVVILQENKGFFCFITQKLLGKPKISKIHLDEMGNFIWPILDGEKNIIKLAELIESQFGEKASPVYDRLVTYIDTLDRYGFIILKK